MNRIAVFIKNWIAYYISNEMSVYAAQASFFTILAAFPFLMFLLAVIDFIPFVRASDLLTFLVRILPDHLDPLILSVLEDIRSSSPGAVLSASAAASLWSSSKGILSIERGLNRVYQVQIQRNYVIRRLICSMYTLLFSIMCVISLFFRFSAFFILFLLILTFYVVLPYKKQPVLLQFPGALFSTLGWGLFSAAFSLYVRCFGRFSVTYGSLTAVVFLMLWLYFCICILFAGAGINALLTDPWIHKDLSV